MRMLLCRAGRLLRGLEAAGCSGGQPRPGSGQAQGEGTGLRTLAAQPAGPVSVS